MFCSFYCVSNKFSQILQSIVLEQIIEFYRIVSSIESKNPIFVVNDIIFTWVLVFKKAKV